MCVCVCTVVVRGVLAVLSLHCRAGENNTKQAAATITTSQELYGIREDSLFVQTRLRLLFFQVILNAFTENHVHVRYFSKWYSFSNKHSCALILASGTRLFFAYNK